MAEELNRWNGTTHVPIATVNRIEVREGGGVRSVTVVVAASNSTALSKAGADFVCTGSNDQNTINAALATIPDSGGELRLLEGDYYVSWMVGVDENYDPIKPYIKNLTISGLGGATRLRTTTTIDQIIQIGIYEATENITIKSMQLIGNTYQAVVVWGGVWNGSGYDYSRNVTLDNLIVKGNQDLCYITNTTDVSIVNCKYNGVNGAGGTIKLSDLLGRVTVENNQLERPSAANSDTGISFNHYEAGECHLHIRNNIFKEFQYAIGIYQRQSGLFASISKNTITETNYVNYSSGINLEGNYGSDKLTDFLVDGNLIVGYETGISLGATKRGSVKSNCLVYDGTQFGSRGISIWMEGDALSVKDNIVSDYGSGIETSGNSNWIVYNDLRGNVYPILDGGTGNIINNNLS